MNEPYREHPSEEALERFLLHMSAEEEVESLETHLLACNYCVEQLEALDTQIAATRLALQQFEARRVSRGSVSRFTRWKSWLTVPKLSFASVGAVVAVAAAFFSIPQEVALTAYRGNETAIVSEGRPLHMHLNAAGVPAGNVALELADGSGSIIWKGASSIRHEVIEATLPRLVQSGPYFLRLYSQPQTGSDGLLLREFALKAKWGI